jgi:hypothetical protein
MGHFIRVMYEADDRSFIGETQLAYVPEQGETLLELFQRIEVLQMNYRNPSIPAVPMTITIKVEED